MKFAPTPKALATSVVLLLIPFAASAETSPPHRFELDAEAGLRFGGSRRVDLEADDGGGTRGRLTARPAPSFGAQAGYRIQSNGFVYLLYSRQETNFEFRSEEPGRELQEARGSVEYFHFGGRLQGQLGLLEPYFGFSLGATRLHSFDARRSLGRFSVAFEPGFTLPILRFLHLRALARLPVTFSSGELVCYENVGCAVAFDSAPLSQGEVQIGLGVRF